MFVSFNLLSFLAWLFISTLLPGAILSLSIFRREKSFTLIEKTLLGFALGFVLLPLIPFLLYIVAGVKYSYSIALLSMGLLYAMALLAFIINRAYEGLIPEKLTISMPMLSKEHIIPAALLLILLLSYLARIGTYSPIFQELDPYYYTFMAHQLLTLGENPVNDSTSWYPEVVVSHRSIPEISYLEGIWFSLYTGGGGYDNMLLALVASMYPPIAAVLSVFFIYLLVSVATERKWGVIAAGIASFAPSFIFKLSAGEQEVQPYAFFALFFFYAMYAISLKRKDLRIPTLNDLNPGKDAIFPILAGLAFSALALGSGSQVLAIASLIIFIMSLSVLYFLRDDDDEGLRHLLLMNAIVFIIGPVLTSAIIKPMFEIGAISLNLAGAMFVPILFAGALKFIKSVTPDRTQGAAALGVILIIGLLLYAMTPLGEYVKNVGKVGFEIAKYNAPLDRTIAEQGTASTEFGGQIGFIAESYTPPASLDSIGSFIDLVMFILMLPFSFVANIMLMAFVSLTNFFLGTDVSFSEKAVSLLLFWIVAFWAAGAFCLWRFMKRENDGMFVFFLAIVMPPLVVGLIKAKYTIYSGVLLAVAIGFLLGQAGPITDAFKKSIRDQDMEKFFRMAPLVLGVLLVLLQFVHQGFAPSLVWGSFQTLYQNDPQALAAKFQQFCDASSDPDVCAAAEDPLGYASRGTNYQYNTKLCMLSVFSNYSYLVYMYDSDYSNNALIPGQEMQTATYRCQRISDYWIDSMEWIRNSTESGARVTSWWDYGHWINYFGLRNAVVRNEHASHKMIGDVAHGYLDATPDGLKAWMEEHGSEYALFDIELVSSGGELGGKYGALNYLSCARDNETSVAKSPGESECEAEHLWENVLVTGNPCTISQLTGKSGYTAYKVYAGGTYLPYYPGFCMAPNDANTMAYCREVIKVVPAYCVGNVTLATGETTLGTYNLNETYPNGDLTLNKALLQLPYPYATTSHVGPATRATLVYTEDAIWLENGVIKSGYEDRKGKFYDSSLYRAIFLNDLPGFTQVYQSSSGAVKIYKIDD